MTSDGYPRPIFKRAIERGNLVVAEVPAREIGRLTLGRLACRPRCQSSVIRLQELR
jgi:hypothetical protein